MASAGGDLLEVYQQLGMLARAGLPLPDGIRQLATTVTGRRMRRELQHLAAETRAGKPLSEAMAQRPMFPAYHVELVRLGERTNALPELLRELVRLAEAERLFVARTREMAAYPLFMTWVASAILLAVYGCVVPGFTRIFQELLAGLPVPALTRLVMVAADIVSGYWIPLMAVECAAAALGLWTIFGGVRARRLMARLLRIPPGAAQIFRAFDHARLCRFWGLLSVRKVGTAEALRRAGELVQDGRLRRRVIAWCDAHDQGRPLAEMIRADGVVDGLLGVAVRHTPEERLPEELMELAEVYEARAQLASGFLMARWSVLFAVGMAVTVGITVLGMFLPLMRLLTILGV